MCVGVLILTADLGELKAEFFVEFNGELNLLTGMLFGIIRFDCIVELVHS